MSKAMVYDTARNRSGFKTGNAYFSKFYFKYFMYFDNAQMFSLTWGLWGYFYKPKVQIKFKKFI